MRNWILIDLVTGSTIGTGTPCPEVYVETLQQVFEQRWMILKTFKQEPTPEQVKRSATWTKTTAIDEPRHRITLTEGEHSRDHYPQTYLEGDILWERFKEGECDAYGNSTTG